MHDEQDICCCKWALPLNSGFMFQTVSIDNLTHDSNCMCPLAHPPHPTEKRSANWFMFDFLCYRYFSMYCCKGGFVNWIQDKVKFLQASNQKNMAQNLTSNTQSLILPFLSQKKIPQRVLCCLIPNSFRAGQCKNHPKKTTHKSNLLDLHLCCFQLPSSVALIIHGGH